MLAEEIAEKLKQRENAGPSPYFVGFDVSPMWGQDESEKEAEELKAQHDKVGEYEELLVDLSGQGGTMVRLVVKEIADRANYLMSQDPQCLAMMKILNSIKMKINFGESLAKSILKKTVAP